MFDFTCPSCEKHRLIDPSRIARIINDDQGICVIFTCWCGEPAAVRTGAPKATAESRPVEHALAS